MQSLMPPVDAPNNEFSDGDPSLGTLGTIVRAMFLNNVQDAIRSVQRELLSILAAANINPDGDSNTQVLQLLIKSWWILICRFLTAFRYHGQPIRHRRDI
ncbi:Uncharacterised protein [Klebsiella pneumoniae]|uniref:Uncharacterized protein n=1 Tax=Klebsiella pneumoniae TaxID=573 RepID=A0A2X3J0N9_KLEPN|nr:Uncharacterised protein [Klebsiella pneumoniae]